jgi:hypothetical protein
VRGENGVVKTVEVLVHGKIVEKSSCPYCQKRVLDQS